MSKNNLDQLEPEIRKLLGTDTGDPEAYLARDRKNLQRLEKKAARKPLVDGLLFAMFVTPMQLVQALLSAFSRRPPLRKNNDPGKPDSEKVTGKA